MATTTTAEQTVRLVLGVARLGEADLAAWWNSHGLDRAGRYVLGRTFRKTWRPAALELDVLSAARRHNDALGSRRTALHLFSDQLPYHRWATSWLAEQKTSTEQSGLFSELESWTLERARTFLEGRSGQIPAVEVVGDGLRLGELSAAELDDDILLPTARLLAACYPSITAPFRAPYFDLRG